MASTDDQSVSRAAAASLAHDEYDDEDDDYFDRLQSYADGLDDELEGDNGNLDSECQTKQYTSEEEYFEAVLEANAVDSHLVLPEESLVWQFVMRDIASNTMQHSSTSGFTMVGSQDLSILSITRQWLFNNLPNSSHVYCFAGFHFMRMSSNATHNYNGFADDCSYRLWVNNVVSPTIMFGAKFPRPGRSSEVTVELFYDPELESSLRNTSDGDSKINWKSTCKEIVITIESEWERIQYVRDGVRSPCKLGLTIMFAGLSSSLYSYFVSTVFPYSNDISEASTCFGSSDWQTVLHVPSYLFVADTAALGTLQELPEGYYYSDLRVDEAAIVNENWPYKDSESFTMITSMINCLPCVGIRSRVDNSLVSWCLTYSNGAIGMLHTVEEHRKKGLGRLVTQKLLSRWCEFEWQCAPFAYSVESNSFAHSTLGAAGFRKCADCVWFAIEKE